MLSRSIITHHYSSDYMHIGGDKTSKSAIFATFGPLDLDLGSGHTSYRRESLIDLYLDLTI